METRIGKIVDVEIERYGGGHNIAGLLYFEVLGEIGWIYFFNMNFFTWLLQPQFVQMMKLQCQKMHGQVEQKLITF